ncbi:hypothetical protein ACLB2K_073764 [Fragaria x ananassa]
MALSIVVSPVTVVRMEAATSDGALPPRNPDPSPRLSFSKPSWVVRTESNVHREVRKTPDPPCEICTGSGRIHCHFCQGKGRTNSVDMQMLPKGKWPRWCKTCGGSGLSYCSRCLGTGEYRWIQHIQETMQMRFKVIKNDALLRIYMNNPTLSQEVSQMFEIQVIDVLCKEFSQFTAMLPSRF